MKKLEWILMDSFDIIKNNIEKSISPSRMEHINSVVDTAILIATSYGVPTDKVKLAAICHDMTKEDFSWNIEKLQGIGIKDPEVLDNKELWHAYTAVNVMLNTYKITDQEVIEAVMYHTIGDENMGNVAKIIYVADYVEPTRCYNGLCFIENKKSLDEWVLLVANEKINFLKKINKQPHSKTLKMIVKLDENIKKTKLITENVL